MPASKKKAKKPDQVCVQAERKKEEERNLLAEEAFRHFGVNLDAPIPKPVWSKRTLSGKQVLEELAAWEDEYYWLMSVHEQALCRGHFRLAAICDAAAIPVSRKIDNRRADEFCTCGYRSSLMSKARQKYEQELIESEIKEDVRRERRNQKAREKRKRKKAKEDGNAGI